MMKTWRKAVTSLLTAGLVCSLTAGNALAGNYQHTVIVYAGGQGSFENGATRIEVEVDHGAEFSTTEYLGQVTLPEDSKYYVKSIQVAGEDGNVVTDTVINEDTDLVVRYGIAQNLVRYQINYVDEEGAELYASDTLYGNVGDQPVVAYRYIEGYQPQTRNISLTLSQNAAENVMTFVYRSTEPEVIVVPTEPAEPETPAAPETPTTPETPAAPLTPVAPQAPAAPQTPAAPAAAGTDAPAADVPAADDTAAIPDEDVPLAGGEAADAAGTDAAQGENITADAGTENGTDDAEGLEGFDDEEVPLANLNPDAGGADGSQSASGIGIGTVAGILAAAAALVVGVLAFVLRKKDEQVK